MSDSSQVVRAVCKNKTKTKHVYGQRNQNGI